MTTVTWRADEELVDRVRQAAEEEGRSMNEYLTCVLDAVTNPDLAGSLADRSRERLARAGLLAAPGEPRHRPSREDVESARRAASGGAAMAELVREDQT